MRAVETHEVDAQENPLTNTVHFGLHKTHKHLSLTSHFHGVALLLANRAWLEALPASTQSAVLAACAEATAAQRQLAIAEDELCLEQLRRDGVAIVPAAEIDFAAFRAAVADCRAQWRSRIRRHPWIGAIRLTPIAPVRHCPFTEGCRPCDQLNLGLLATDPISRLRTQPTNSG